MAKKTLVLGGGGSKGAYQVGAYKALVELGHSFDLVVGTSIGALNGALMILRFCAICGRKSALKKSSRMGLISHKIWIIILQTHKRFYHFSNPTRKIRAWILPHCKGF